MKNVRLPAEWEPLDAVMITWPHPDTDWALDYDNVLPAFTQMVSIIAKYAKVLLVHQQDIEDLSIYIKDINPTQLCLLQLASNDSWARDHGPILTWAKGKPQLVKFTFNAWGLKFASQFDNQISKHLFEKQVFNPEMNFHNRMDLCFEGGAIDSDGHGTLLTTMHCLTAPNRNEHLELETLKKELLNSLGASRFLCLENGYLEGDDTDSHVDMLARFCDAQTIAYMACEDKDDVHYQALKAMERELQSFRTLDGKAYNLVALPLPQAVYDADGQRLPASYANFLICNQAVIVPVYGVENDRLALKRLSTAFLSHQILPINAMPFIRQKGAVHCLTMQIPKGFLR